MTYAKGSVASAADYNALAGLTASAAGSSAAALAAAGYLWGVGYGSAGYGQTTPVLTALGSGTLDQAAAWTNLNTVLTNLATWQNTTVTLPTQVAGAVAVAYPSGASPSVVDTINTLATNRANYQTANMTLTSSAATTAMTTTWGGGGTTPGDQAQCALSITFASEDQARFFFNTGGEVRIALAHPNTSTTQDTAWNTILNNLVIAFRGNSSVRLTGSYGTAAAIGYYQLTSSYQTILNGTSVFSSPYASNSFIVEAIASSITGVNGGNGTKVTFRITLTDGHTNSFYDAVQAGTNATMSHLRAGSGLAVLPPAPTCAVASAFTGTPASTTPTAALSVAIAGSTTQSTTITSDSSTGNTNWTTGVGLPASQQWADIAWNGSRWVAVGGIGSATTTGAYSTDGINWTAMTMPSGRYTSVTWNGSMFLATSATAVVTNVATSPDGITWTAQTTQVSSGHAMSSAWNGSKWVVVYGYNVTSAVVGLSSDGVTWTTGSLPANAYLSDIAWNGSVFCAVAGGTTTTETSAVCYTSPDGITWTARTMPTNQNWSAIAWNGSVFCAIPWATSSGVATATFATSPDGITWTSQATGLASLFWSDITWNGTMFIVVAGGKFGAQTTAIAATSPDGVTWTQIAQATSTYWSGIKSARFQFGTY